ncbi:MAG TPA: tetratricopeptide repeat protein, partial [Gemmatimonadales bacterium]
VVGQAELLAAGFALLAVERYLAWREEGSLGPGRRVLLAAATLFAIASKETGYAIPLLLLAAEVLLAGRGTGWRDKYRALAPTMFLQAGAAFAAILVRVIVLGPTTGAGPSVAFQGLSTGARAAGMLAVVPQWGRLMLWPAHLQAEYGPPAIPMRDLFGPAHLLGIFLLALWVFLLLATRRRAPAVAFGLVWLAIALLPVSNLLAPTGVILAERTLFLPSVGAMLALGGGLALLPPPLRDAGALPVRAAGVLVAGLVLAGTVRSSGRQLAWKEQAGFFRTLEADAPTTYRAHLVASNFYSEAGDYQAAERAARRALELYDGDPKVFEQLGQMLRRQGRCREALPVLADGVRRFPDGTVIRSRLIECSLATGDTARAMSLAEEAVRLGQPEFGGTVRRLRGKQSSGSGRR